MKSKKREDGLWLTCSKTKKGHSFQEEKEKQNTKK
jgi:hypothetical protein